MINEYSKELKQIYLKYPQIHSEIDELENIVKNVADRREKLSQELKDTRKAELILINKIEESLNRKLTQEDLIKMIELNEQR
jgi:hypothetical protein